ncbi:MAG TPA: ABC transporter ATP-binding protein [Bavariicoccus seileri]|uniref:ABC transporter ATP-binding protein n=2 Tax=Bavariicoccus seileri TaxID=549685 RepID=A0A3D4S2X5_9ENTE|nr:ABC transporter ATP-binding protein [Bavariicoccus seileri]HCS93185.1 ABC transporter ATP-binding protein [Bavariicoccus seileri]
MIDITKEFGNFKANDGINLSIRKGEVHALLGENGAGKSTLMNILSGLLEPTSGEIKINGETVKITSPNVANQLGIGMVHQHFMLVGKFTVTENIMLGKEISHSGYINIKKAQKKVQELSDHYKLSVNPNALVRDISVGMEQRVEILKTLYRGADILIFDEPTAVLTPQEIDELIQIMRQLTLEGKSIILITHKLDEIKQVADRCTVIRRGKSIDTVDVDKVSTQNLADMMVGRQVQFKTVKEPSNPKEVVLDIEHLTVKDSRNVTVVDDLDLSIRGGEIIGLAGIDGNGQSELIQAITGLRSVTTGSIKIKDIDITNQSPRFITESGVGHIPEDRQKYGLILQLPLDKNMVLESYYKAPFSKHGILNDQAITEYAKRLIDEFDVRTTSEKSIAGSLSGGNQQKAIIAREVDKNPDLLIAAQPTRGLDVGAIEYIHKRLIEQRDQGKAVLLMSFELDEIFNLSDKIAVMYDGKIVKVLNASETDESEIGLLMVGSSKEDKETATEEEAV